MKHLPLIFLFWTLAGAALAFAGSRWLGRILKPRGSLLRTTLHILLTLLLAFVIIVIGNAWFLLRYAH